MSSLFLSPCPFFLFQERGLIGTIEVFLSFDSLLFFDVTNTLDWSGVAQSDKLVPVAALFAMCARGGFYFSLLSCLLLLTTILFFWLGKISKLPCVCECRYIVFVCAGTRFPVCLSPHWFLYTWIHSAFQLIPPPFNFKNLNLFCNRIER